jgi:hypothetical protein
VIHGYELSRILYSDLAALLNSATKEESSVVETNCEREQAGLSAVTRWM